MLWFGWYGFNAGSEFNVDTTTALAFLNTDIAASFAAVTWLAIEWTRTSQPKFVGLLTGAVAGLATITPAAGFVSPLSSVIIGIVSAIVCYLAVMLKNKLKLDDALDVWGVHGVGGFLGSLLLGVFADKSWNPAGVDGMFFGDSSFLYKQLIGVTIATVWSFVFTYGMLWLIDHVTPVRIVNTNQNDVDKALHGEMAYVDAFLEGQEMTQRKTEPEAARLNSVETKPVTLTCVTTTAN